MSSDIVRVSCSGLVYPVIDDKFAGHYSGSKLNHKPPIWYMTLFGGKYLYDEQTLTLLQKWGAQLEKEGQLSFLMHPKHLDEFTAWFFAREGRELFPCRELGEELVDEERLFLDREVYHRLDQGVVLRKFTERVGYKGPLTHYFIEIFRLTLNPRDLDVFRAADANPKSWVRLVTSEEAKTFHMNRPGSPEHGAEVGEVFQFFGLPHDELKAIAGSCGQKATFLSENVVYEGTVLP